MDHPSHIGWCILPEVVHSAPSASSLHLFMPVDTCTGVWVQDWCSIFQSWKYKGLVCPFSDTSIANVEVTSEKTKCSWSFGCNTFNLVLPSKVLADCNPKVLCTVSCFQRVSMQFVYCLHRYIMDVHMLMTWHFSGWNFILPRHHCCF